MCVFVYKLLNGYVNCLDLLSNLTFLVPGHTTRQSDTFYVPFQRTLYGKNSPLVRTMKHVNNLNINIFICNSIDSFNLYLNDLITLLLYLHNTLDNCFMLHIIYYCNWARPFNN